MADSERSRLEGHDTPPKCPHMSMIVGRLMIATFSELSVEQGAMILGFFRPMEIIYFRRVCKTWKEAARVTTVPMQIPFFYGKSFRINTLARYNALRVMATELPNLQQFEIASLCDERYLSPLDGHKYSDGGDPDEEEAAETAHYTTHDIEIISNLRKLRHLEIMTSLN